jgi:hypothetical protein
MVYRGISIETAIYSGTTALIFPIHADTRKRLQPDLWAFDPRHPVAYRRMLKTLA